MKKLLSLLVVVTVVSSVTGCGCCRRMRDLICRGARCGPATAASMVAPAAPVMPMAACPPQMAPMAYDPGCSYDPGVQTYGYGGYPVDAGYDSGWSTSCPDCAGGSYALPSYGGDIYPADPGDSGVAPGPAPVE